MKARCLTHERRAASTLQSCQMPFPSRLSLTALFHFIWDKTKNKKRRSLEMASRVQLPRTRAAVRKLLHKCIFLLEKPRFPRGHSAIRVMAWDLCRSPSFFQSKTVFPKAHKETRESRERILTPSWWSSWLALRLVRVEMAQWGKLLTTRKPRDWSSVPGARIKGQTSQVALPSMHVY